MSRVLAAFTTALVAGGATAGAADYVFMPSVTNGERELDFKYGAASAAKYATAGANARCC